MDCIVHGVIKSWTQLSDFQVPHYFFCLKEEKLSFISEWHFPRGPLRYSHRLSFAEQASPFKEAHFRCFQVAGARSS